MQVRAKKNLGQHFLRDLGVASRIAATIESAQVGQELGSLPVLEIGPGMGVLTRFLLNAGRDLTAVELDSESVEFLHTELPQLRVVEGDFLKLDLDAVIAGPMALIGNYPYNISSQIFFKVLDYRDKIPLVSGMLQKEVAERICASPGGKVYGILSVLLQAWYDCEYLFSVPPGVFNPPPKVTSGVLRLRRNSRTELGVPEPLFRLVVKTAFGRRRKTLRNSIGALIEPGHPILTDPIMQQRPERLGVEEFIRLTKALRRTEQAEQEGRVQ